MLNFTDACAKAVEYFETNLKVNGLAKATENDGFWFFSGGVQEANPIGMAIISVDKKDGGIRLIDMLSKVGFELLQNSSALDIPSQYRG